MFLLVVLVVDGVIVIIDVKVLVKVVVIGEVFGYIKGFKICIYKFKNKIGYYKW